MNTQPALPDGPRHDVVEIWWQTRVGFVGEAPPIYRFESLCTETRKSLLLDAIYPLDGIPDTGLMNTDRLRFRVALIVKAELEKRTAKPVRGAAAGIVDWSNRKRQPLGERPARDLANCAEPA